MTRMDAGVGSNPPHEGPLARHDEWLIDEAVEQTFPASDPSSAGQPGSIVSLRYADQQQARRSRLRRRSRGALWLAAAGVALGVALLATRLRRRTTARWSRRRRFF